jgi:hypothetical protein
MSDRHQKYYAVRRDNAGQPEWWDGSNPDSPEWGYDPYLDVDDTFCKVIAEKHNGDVVVFAESKPDTTLSLRAALASSQAEVERLRGCVRAYVEWTCKRCSGYGSCGTWSPTCRECPIYAEVPR